jgi:hypothetical protein
MALEFQPSDFVGDRLANALMVVFDWQASLRNDGRN